MNITFTIDCTPTEAREFFGLPDVKDMQSDVMEKMREQMTAGMGKMDAAELMKTWMPSNNGAMEQMQEFFAKFGAQKRD